MKLASLKLYRELQLIIQSAYDLNCIEDAIFAELLVPDKVILLNLLQSSGRLSYAIMLAESMGNTELTNILKEKLRMQISMQE